MTITYIPYNMWDYVTQNGEYNWFVYGLIIGLVWRFVLTATWRKPRG